MQIVLPQFATEQQRLVRERTLAQQRAAYRWCRLPGVPPFCEGVPEGEEQSVSRKESLLWDAAGNVANMAASVVARLGLKPWSIKYFNHYYRTRPAPVVAKKAPGADVARWRTDKEFARQRLNGVNPFMIKRVEQVPGHFPVTDDLAGAITGGQSLADLISAHRLYMVDYAGLEGCPTNPGRFLTPVMAMFWVNDAGTLMPLAIQLGQTPTEAPTIFTPAVEEWKWLTARTHLQAADAAYHELVAHLLRTHLVMETVWVAACRTLPAQHPVHELLKPHFTGTIAINQSARSIMLAKGGPIDEAIACGADGAYWLIDQAWQTWTFDDIDPIEDLARRGVGDAEILPGYHYRDDAVQLWALIKNYVHQILEIFYATDLDVQEDLELQDWAVEMSDSDAGGGLRGLGLSTGISSREELHTLICRVIYCCSVEHAAVNNGQYDIFGYIPNAPGAMWKPPPTSDAASNEAQFCGGLPPIPDVISDQMMLVHMLSMPTTTPLGTYPTDFFHSVWEARAAVDSFRGDRDDIINRIADRNEQLIAEGELPYSYLNPMKVGRSISI